MFTVKFVDESALPSGHTWVIGATPDGQRFLFIKEGARCSRTIEEAWEAGHLLNLPDFRVAV